jgi:tetratricopeptide (TPR) repeat protein
MRRAARWLIAAGLVAHAADPARDKPVGLVARAGQGVLLRSGTALELATRPGDLLFAGDRVRSLDGETTIWFCPASQRIQIAAGSVIEIGSASIASVDRRNISLVPISFCPAPEITRERLERPAFVGRQIGPDPATRSPEGEVEALSTENRSRLQVELRAIDTAVDQAELRIAARAAAYSRFGLHASAAREFESLAGSWNKVDWPRRLVHEEHELQSRGETMHAAIGGEGQTYALLVGISDYPLLRPEQRLHFADRDAELMYAYLRSARGGGLPESNIRLLRNRDATAAAIRTQIAEFLKARASRNDTVLLLIAAHGVSLPGGAYIVAYDSDPDNLPDTGINMLEIQDLLEGGLEHVGHILIFADVCHAGLIGNIANRNFARTLQILGRLQGEETFGLLASAPDERSVESERFGGGHGAFSYFLSRALNGDADEDGDRRVTVNELQAYVYNMVRRSTRSRQNPRTTGDMPGERVLIPDLSRAGIEIAGWGESEAVAGAQPRDLPASRYEAWSSPEPEVQEFERALTTGDLLPPGTGNALDLLARLRASHAGNPLQIQIWENALRTALQDRGQAVLLQYLRGDEVPQARDDFARGARWFEAAVALDSEALALQSRAWFCNARALLYENRTSEALDLLERAVRIEPNGPYIYNALGLLFLQQAEYGRATAAFRDAIRLAPYWSYPKHNLALTYVQTGSYDQAIGVYRDARRLAPRAWFIPYNQGLVEQSMQRWGEAEKLFHASLALAPQRAEPETALGYLAALRGRYAEAERFYRAALGKQPGFVPAMHNLALVLDQSRHTDEAIPLWNEVLRREPGFAASRLALAAALERAGQREQALDQYREALRQDPQLKGAELAASRLLLSLGQPDQAVELLRETLATEKKNAAAWELLGDVLSVRTPAEAREAYERALLLAGGEERGRISKKLRRLGRP